MLDIMDQPKEYNKQEKTKGNIKILLMKINEILIVIPPVSGVHIKIM